ncbi:MAG TPA: hypothetical protein VF035_07100 [Longimicrobiales bacterium]
MTRTIVRNIWLAGLMAAAPLAAQTETLDEGTFRITVSGAEVGVETFSIRRSGSGPDAVVMAKGRVVLDASRGGQQIQANVQLAGPTLRPAAYEVEVRGGDAQGIRATVRGSRVSARITSSAGENMREYLVSDGAVLVDEGVAHQYYFLARRATGSSTNIPIVMPRQSKQVTATVTARGDESIQIGGTAVQARHLVVQPAGSAAVDVWADAEGRILKVEIPTRNYMAVRTALP